MKISEIFKNKKPISETATVGATSSGSIATVSVPLGGWIGFNPLENWRSIYYQSSKRTTKNIKKRKKIK